VGIILRNKVMESDINAIIKMTEDSGFFNEEEIEITTELVNLRFNDGAEKSGYNFIVLEADNKVVGFSCYGKIPCTKSSYDLYWIVVEKKYKHQGFGKKLLIETEKQIKNRAGKKVYIETSSTDLYEPTRAFYEKNSYKTVAVIKDFYDNNDHKCLYEKEL